MREFSVRFHLADTEYMTALRLACGALGSVHELDVDSIEDFKVCVTESAIILKNCGFDELCAVFSGCGGLCCTLTGVGGEPCVGDNELSLALISALVGECDITRNGEIIERVKISV